MDWRIGIDVGGTFTDFVLTGGGRAPVTWKQPSDRLDPSGPVVRGVEALMARAGIDAAQITGVVHGATLALNAVIERRGARVGLVVSQGYGDILTLRRGGLPHSYNYKAQKPVPLVPRPLVHEIPARQRPDGSPVLTPTVEDIDRVAAQVRADGVEALAVLVVNSYAHPAMEADLAEALAARLSGVLVTASAAILPEVREFERALITVMNGYIHPLMDAYFARLAERLSGIGVTAPLDIATSTGGVIGVRTARSRPIETLLSGPAAGVAAAARLATAAGLDRAVTFDMGGTSSDIAVILDGRPEVAQETYIEDHPLILPVVAVTAIGSGGGSIGWVDPQGVLKVGPDSAGAAPGPACYGKGGQDAAITDAWLELGFIDPAHFLGGRMALDAGAARAALTRLGAGVGIAGPDAARDTARAMLRIATARMATEIGKAMAQRGLDPAEFTLIAYGGAGPTQAVALAEMAGLPRVTIPPMPSTFCAFGAVSGSLRRDFSRSRRLVLEQDEDAAAQIAQALSEMRAEAELWAREEGRTDLPSLLLRADMQYPRTAVDLTVEVPGASDPDSLTELFHDEHERLYGFRDRTSPVHLTTLRLTASFPAPAMEITAQTDGSPAPSPSGRLVHWDSGALETPVHLAPLPSWTELVGPAVVEMEDSTVLVPPGWHLATDERGAMHLTKEGTA